MIENTAPKFSKRPIKIIGCGLAGAEIAFVLANNGFDVHIFDKNFQTKILISDFPNKEKTNYTDKYTTYLTDNMKFELECLNSPLLTVAKKFDVSDFGFVYDREFMNTVRKILVQNPKIKVFDMKIDELNAGETTVIATGHSTTNELLKELEKMVGERHVCHFQPQSIVIDAKSVDIDNLNFLSENTCYINLSEEEYDLVYKTIVDLDKSYNQQEFADQNDHISIEQIAKRGREGLRNSVLRPYFLENATLDKRPYASLKCKYDKINDVLIFESFFSNFEDEDQYKVITQIDTLKSCKVERYSQIQRKNYLLTPMTLNENLQILNHENIYVCGGLAGLADPFEILLMADYCAFNIIAKKKNKLGVDLLREKTCIGLILQNMLKKSVVNFRLFNLKYDIINNRDAQLKLFNKQVEIQKILSKSQIEKFKEKFYGKYF